MLIIPPAQFRTSARAREAAKAVGPVLTQAIVIPVPGSTDQVVLVFDRPVNTALGLMERRGVRVDDQPNGHWYLATGGLYMPNPNAIQLTLVLGVESTSGIGDATERRSYEWDCCDERRGARG